MRPLNTRSKSLVSVIFIGILLFNYVSSTMFWHSHLVDGRIVWHSHIYGKAHDTDSSDGGHTPGQLKLLDVLSHILCIDTVIPDIHIERTDILETILYQPIAAGIPAIHLNICSLRGPPVY